MRNIIAFALISLVIFSCQKNSTSTTPPPTDPIIPSLTTAYASFVSRTTATIGGNISSDGGALIISRGICYNTSPTPTITNNTVASGAGAGTFSSILSFLLPNTTYYARAFATNSIGTAYGNEVTFTTLALTTPTVSTNSTATTNVTFNTISGGNITDDGGSPITARGLCWSTSFTPTIADSKTIDGTGIGTYNSTIINLNANTTYYLRAYATNNLGTNYGNSVSIVLDVEGNVYNTIKIGTQVWMLENLKSTKLNNGVAIPNVTDNLQWSDYSVYPLPRYCWYNNDINNKTIYGAMYNWPTVNTGILAPVGWHVPTRIEFGDLIKFLDPNFTSDTVPWFHNTYMIEFKSSYAAGKLKEAGTSHWQSPNSGSPNNLPSTNESGFTALPGGLRHEFGGGFDYLKTTAGFWTSTPDNTPSPNNCYKLLLSHGYNLSVSPDGIRMGYSVRCIKN